MIFFQISGNSDHGLALFTNTAGEKLSYLLGKFNDFQNEELRKLYVANSYKNVTTINLTIVKGGDTARNVVPAQMSATFDIRVAVTTNLDEFQQMVSIWN